LRLDAFSIVTANSGPGNRTPDIEISATEAKNKGKSLMIAMLFQLSMHKTN
jgi:hypothetical protein